MTGECLCKPGWTGSRCDKGNKLSLFLISLSILSRLLIEGLGAKTSVTFFGVFFFFFFFFCKTN